MSGGDDSGMFRDHLRKRVVVRQRPLKGTPRSVGHSPQPIAQVWLCQ